MPKLVTWMNNQRVGELTKLANGAHTFKYAPEWLANPRHFTTSFQHFRYWVAQEYTSAISNWQWGLTHPKAKKRQSIKFIRDIFWRQQRC
ncbi:TPA: HipA N-terminal domain-containing protein [Escherichia coli]|nr:HipA N-terminal domain-containing protein [Escherichia coli]HBH7998851.1 HipA N-terminal domain-containing protein [Escherichia coli]HBH8041128.1 HipA N-terminal domain-containing protein [Escherichia coli]HBK2953744.1 HipA N-terminal domain-containing protein [Escherichia coli]HCJ8595624.1 HipA N-terminal domain-containing protein [Escherichia coli]